MLIALRLKSVFEEIKAIQRLQVQKKVAMNITMVVKTLI